MAHRCTFPGLHATVSFWCSGQDKRMIAMCPLPLRYSARENSLNAAANTRPIQRSGTVTGTARLDDDVGDAAAVAEAVLLAVDVEAPEEEGLLEDEKMSVWLVTVAVRPVTFWQLELTVVLMPGTKLTAAH